MDIATPDQRYPRPVRLMHWIMAILVIGMLVLGLSMTSLAKDDPLRGTWFNLHKSLGVAVLVLACLRVGIRLANAIPPLPKAIPRWQHHAAAASHMTLYVLLFAMPLSGIAMSQGVGFGVSFFGLKLPRIFPIDKAMGMAARETHEILAYALIALILLHVAGVAKHLLIERINLLKRLW